MKNSIIQASSNVIKPQKAVRIGTKVRRFITEGAEVEEDPMHDFLLSLKPVDTHDFRPWIMYPGHHTDTRWDYIVLFFIFLSFVHITIFNAFVKTDKNDPTLNTYDNAFTIVLDAFFVVDLIVSFRRAYTVKVMGDLYIQDKPNQIARNYSRGWLVPDLLALNVPFLIVPPENVGGGYQALELMKGLRLLRLLKVNTFFQARIKGTVQQAVRMAVLYVLLCHMSAYSMHNLGYWEKKQGYDSWLKSTVGEGDVEIWEMDAFHRYVHCFYWGVTTVTTTGYGDMSPVTTLEMLLTIAIMMVATVCTIFILANLSSAVASWDRANNHRLEHLQSIEDLITFFRVPTELRKRLRDAGEYVAMKTQGFDPEEVLNTIPHSLSLDIKMHMHAGNLKKVPLFSGISNGALAQVVDKLHGLHVVANEIVFRIGDKSLGMYIVRKGLVAILARNGECKTQLGAGTCFGEIGLFGETNDSNRTATAVVLKSAHLYILSRDDFEEVCDHYPEIQAAILKQAESYQDRKPANQASRRKSLMMQEQKERSLAALVMRKFNIAKRNSMDTKKPSLEEKEMSSGEGQKDARLVGDVKDIDARLLLLQEQMRALTTTVTEGFRVLQSRRRPTTEISSSRLPDIPSSARGSPRSRVFSPLTPHYDDARVASVTKEMNVVPQSFIPSSPK